MTMLDPLPGEISALHVKSELMWPNERFSVFCQRVIGKVGLTCANEDRRVRDAMRLQIVEAVR